MLTLNMCMFAGLHLSVLRLFSIKNILYDKMEMDLRVFHFHMTKYRNIFVRIFSYFVGIFLAMSVDVVLIS